MEVERGQAIEQESMVDSVKCFRKVSCGDNSTERGFALVKPRSDFSDKGKKGGSGGPTMDESMLERSTRKRGTKKRKN